MCIWQEGGSKCTVSGGGRRPDTGDEKAGNDSEMDFFASFHIYFFLPAAWHCGAGSCPLWGR